MRRRVFRQNAIEIEPVRAAVQCHFRFMPHFGRQCLDLRARNVRRIGQNQVERFLVFHRLQKIAVPPLDAFVDTGRRAVFPRDRKRLFGQVHRDGPGLFAKRQKRNGYRAASRPQIQQGNVRQIAVPLDDRFQPCFRVRPRHQDVLVYGKRKSHEFPFPDQNGRAKSRHTFLNQFLESGELRAVDNLFPFRVQINARFSQDVPE